MCLTGITAKEWVIEDYTEPSPGKIEVRRMTYLPGIPYEEEQVEYSYDVSEEGTSEEDTWTPPHLLQTAVRKKKAGDVMTWRKCGMCGIENRRSKTLGGYNSLCKGCVPHYKWPQYD